MCNHTHLLYKNNIHKNIFKYYELHLTLKMKMIIKLYHETIIPKYNMLNIINIYY